MRQQLRARLDVTVCRSAEHAYTRTLPSRCREAGGRFGRRNAVLECSWSTPRGDNGHFRSTKWHVVTTKYTKMTMRRSAAVLDVINTWKWMPPCRPPVSALGGGSTTDSRTKVTRRLDICGMCFNIYRDRNKSLGLLPSGKSV